MQRKVEIIFQVYGEFPATLLKIQFFHSVHVSNGVYARVISNGVYARVIYNGVYARVIYNGVYARVFLTVCGIYVLYEGYFLTKELLNSFF